jgi:hypothetical protein
MVFLALVGTDIYLHFHPQKPVPGPSPATTAPPLTPAASLAAPTVVPTSEPTVAVTESTAAPPAAPVVADAATAPAPAAKPGVHKKPAAPPATAPPSTPKPATAAPAEHPVSARTFILGETSVEAASGAMPGVPAGFDPGGVDAKAAPRIPARVDLQVEPKMLRGGDPYVLKIYVRNDGKKTIKVRDVRVGSSFNGVRAESTLTPRQKEVPASQVALVAEVSSTWRADVKTWAMDVAVRSGHGEVYKNSVVWR